MPEEDGSLKTTVFRKPTHTDLYLQWDSHHTLPSKYSVIGTLLHRAKTIWSDPHLLKQDRRSPVQGSIYLQVPHMGPK